MEPLRGLCGPADLAVRAGGGTRARAGPAANGPRLPRFGLLHPAFRRRRPGLPDHVRLRSQGLLARPFRPAQLRTLWIRQGPALRPGPPDLRQYARAPLDCQHPGPQHHQRGRREPCRHRDPARSRARCGCMGGGRRSHSRQRPPSRLRPPGGPARGRPRTLVQPPRPPGHRGLGPRRHRA